MQLRTDRRRVLRRNRRQDVEVLWRLRFRLDAEPEEISLMEHHYVGDDLIVANEHMNAQASTYVPLAGEFRWTAADLVGKWAEVPNPVEFDRAVLVNTLVIEASRTFGRMLAVLAQFEGESSLDIPTST